MRKWHTNKVSIDRHFWWTSRTFLDGLRKMWDNRYNNTNRIDIFLFIHIMLENDFSVHLSN